MIGEKSRLNGRRADISPDRTPFSSMEDAVATHHAPVLVARDPQRHTRSRHGAGLRTTPHSVHFIASLEGTTYHASNLERPPIPRSRKTARANPENVFTAASSGRPPRNGGERAFRSATGSLRTIKTPVPRALTRFVPCFTIQARLGRRLSRDLFDTKANRQVADGLSLRSAGSSPFRFSASLICFYSLLSLCAIRRHIT